MPHTHCNNSFLFLCGKTILVVLTTLSLTVIGLFTSSLETKADEPVNSQNRNKNFSIEVLALTPEILTDENEVSLKARVRSKTSSNETLVKVFVEADPFTSLKEVKSHLRGAGDYGWATAEYKLNETEQKLAKTVQGTEIEVRFSVDDLPFWNTSAWGPYGVEIRAIENQDVSNVTSDHTILMWYPNGSKGNTALNLLLPSTVEPGALSTLLGAVRPGVTLALPPPQAKALLADMRGTDAEIIALPEQRADLSMLASVDQTGLFQLAWDSRNGNGKRNADTNPASPNLITDVMLATDGWMSLKLLQAARSNTVLTPPNGLDITERVTVTPSSKTVMSSITGQAVSQNTIPSAVTVIDSWHQMAALISASTPGLSKLNVRQQIRSLTALLTVEDKEDKRFMWVNIPSTIDANSINDRLNAALDAPWIQPVSLQKILDSPVSVVPRTPIGDATFGDLTTTSRLMNQLGTLFDLAKSISQASPDGFLSVRESTSEFLYPTACGISLDERSSRVSEVTPQLTETFDVIEVAPTRTVNVMNSNADFPVTVSNKGDFPVTVEVGLQTEDVRLQPKGWVKIVVPSSGTATAQIPVTAVGSGDVNVLVVARTPQGAVLDGSQEVDVRVRAGLEDTLTWVVVCVVGSLFILGLVRTLRKGKRSANQARVHSWQ